jgi:MYXO-CTERM domain-containing protein
VLLFLTTATASTWVVDPGGGGDATTIMGGVALAATGDVVQVQPGTYREDVDFQARTFTLESTDGSTTTFLVGSGDGPVVRVDSGEGPGTAIAGFTVQGGDASAFDATGNAGGGLYSVGVPLSIDDLVFVENVAEFGGGALVGQAENIDVRGSVFSGNRAHAGAGLYVLEGSATVSDCSFDGNVADIERGVGGGLTLYAATVGTRDSEFIGNAATAGGGAVYAAEGATFTCTFCDLIEGTAETGGGVYASASDVFLTSSTVTTNVGTAGGGGLYATAASMVQLYAVLLDANDAEFGAGGLLSDSSATGVYADATRNIATSAGGGWYVDESDLSLTTSTLADNVAETSNGGGIAFDTATGMLDAVIFSNNTGYSGGGIHLNSGSVGTFTHLTMVENASSGSAGGVRVSDGGTLSLVNSIVAYSSEGSGVSAGSGASVTLRYDDFWTNASGPTSGGLADPTGSNGNIAENPLFVSFAQDGLSTDDLHLSAGSPCIDAGDPSTFDADGSRADMGAYGGANGSAWDDVDADVDGWSTAEGDCDDADGSVFPGAPDGCDDVDQDCDGVAREGCDTGTDPTGDDTGTDPNGDDTGTTVGTDETGSPATGDDTAVDVKDGGCGCASGPRGAAWLGLLAAAALVRRRRE